MTLRIVRLGPPKEGTRIGTVRRPLRGVRKQCYAADNWFDIWYPWLAPSAKLMTQGQNDGIRIEKFRSHLQGADECAGGAADT